MRSHAMTERLVSRASKGQLAMAAVMAGAARQMSMSVSAGLAGVSTRSVGRAAMVLAHAPHLVDAVLSGERPLKDAYAEACSSRLRRGGDARRNLESVDR